MESNNYTWIAIAIVVGIIGFAAGHYLFPTTVEKIVEVDVEPPATIKIGCSVPLSGWGAPTFGKSGIVAETLEEIINERGGIYIKKYNANCPVDFIIYDDRSDPTIVVSNYERLITVDNVDACMGAVTSYLAISASTIAEKYDVPMVHQCANDIFVYSQGNEWIACPLVPIQDKPKYYFEMLAKEGKAETIAIVHADDTLFTGLAMGAKKYAEQAGLEIVYVEMLPAATTDFTAVITPIKELNPDIVYDAGFGVAFVKQAKELGLEPNEFYSHGSSGLPFIEGLGARAEYVMDEMWTPPPGQELGNVELWEEVYTRAGFDPLEYTFVASCYMSYEVLLEALQRVEDYQDSEQLRDTILTQGYLTIGGLCSFNTTSLESGYGLGTIYAYPTQIIDGRPMVVAPEWAKVTEHIYPSN